VKQEIRGTFSGRAKDFLFPVKMVYGKRRAASKRDEREEKMDERAEDLRRYLENLTDELNSTTLYLALAESEKNPKVADIYRRLAATEQGHADAWAERIRAGGGTVPVFRPSWQTRTLIWIARRFGIPSVLPTLSSIETSASRAYGLHADSREMVASENSHARVLRHVGQTSGGGLEGGVLARFEGRHRSAGGNALRAAVLGASDGLISNFNLVMGVAGAQLSSGSILLTGVAGLLAGSISMALGEWISVQSSRELYEKQLQTEKEEIATMPEEEVEELSLIYQARGLDREEAYLLASRIMSNPDTALDTLAREELGINPEDLGGSAWEAALTSFLLFAVGAILPVIPFIFLEGLKAIAASAVLSGIGLFITGAAITLFTGRSVWHSGMRQVFFGLAAAAVTFTIGHLLGVSIAG
jgi:VIT1/CCC1 family predicted Fe2+/Mn2+ transporter